MHNNLPQQWVLCSKFQSAMVLKCTGVHCFVKRINGSLLSGISGNPQFMCNMTQNIMASYNPQKKKLQTMQNTRVGWIPYSLETHFNTIVYAH